MAVELEESKDNVAKRLELIESDLKKIDTSIGSFINLSFQLNYLLEYVFA